MMSGRQSAPISACDGSADLLLVEERIVGAVEFAEIFLGEVAGPEGAAFLFEEGGPGCAGIRWRGRVKRVQSVPPVVHSL